MQSDRRYVYQSSVGFSAVIISNALIMYGIDTHTHALTEVLHSCGVCLLIPRGHFSINGPALGGIGNPWTHAAGTAEC